MPDDTTKPVVDPAVLNAVKLWTKRIKDAKKFYEKDFTRMKENMEFAAGIQWAAQTTIESTDYVANFVNRETNQKVANLYAKDPKSVYRRRKRMDYQIWDGEVASMQAAHMTIASAQGQMTPQVVAAQALLTDIQHGKTMEKMIDRVGKTLEILYGYECDTQAPDFKYQMKQLVRRVVTTGVGYVRLNFSRQMDHALTHSGTDDSLSMRLKRARNIMEGINDDTITEDDPRREQLESLFHSVETSVADGDQTNVEERLEFDFPSATSVIIDPKCQSLKGFIGARWVVQQFIMPLEDVNAYFGTSIQAGGELVQYSENGIEKLKQAASDDKTKDPQEKPLCCLWEVFDIQTKSNSFIIDGWKDYVQGPKPLTPSINRFWPIFSLTFNDVEVEPGGKVHIYPPSDVELIRHPQKEWNRSRNELIKQRKSNRPWYATVSGWLTGPDKDKIANHESSELVEFSGMPPGGDISKAFLPVVSATIDQNMVNTQPLMEDVGLVIGSNQSLQQQPLRHVAATPAVIQEQARMSGANSNVDDLDDLLSELARAGGEMMLKEFSPDTVKRIVGVGSAWPEQNKEEYLNLIYLDVVAASSGRPNKAVDVATATQLVPLLTNAGANPWAIIKYVCGVVDANIDPSDFAPTTPPPVAPQGQQGAKPQQPATPGIVGQQQGGLGYPVPVHMGGMA